jgi:hypothetical protein
MNTSGTWTLSTDELVKLVLPQLLAASSREVRSSYPCLTTRRLFGDADVADVFVAPKGLILKALGEKVS